MKKIRIYQTMSANDNTSPKGSAENPYSREEFDNYGDNWPGGYVEGLGYVAADNIINGSSSSESSYSDYSSEDDSLSGSLSSMPSPSGNASGGGGGGDVNNNQNSSIELNLGGNKGVSVYSQNLLRNLKGYKGKIVVTSTMRTPEQQAKAMLNNIKKTSVQYQKSVYGKYGDQVLDTYNPNNSDNTNLMNMTSKIYELGPQNVSHHCLSSDEQKRLNVMDISASSLSSKQNFKDALKAADSKIKVLDENGCIHIEIPQP